MSKVYDVFADEYIDEREIDPIAPPERYKEITLDLIVQNAARWFIEGLSMNDEAMNDEVEGDA